MRELCDSLAAGILKICEANNTKIACAESLTGGLLADAFVRIPGASNVLLGSAVTYDINAKLDPARGQGPIGSRRCRTPRSRPADGRRYRSPIQPAGIRRPNHRPFHTGVAGPGPDGDKPAGLVYVGLRIPASLTPDHAEVLKAVELHLDGMREEIRRLTVFHVLQNLSLFTASFKE